MKKLSAKNLLREVRSLKAMLKESRGKGIYTAIVSGTWFETEVQGKSIDEVLRELESEIHDQGSYSGTGFSTLEMGRAKVHNDGTIKIPFTRLDGNGDYEKESMTVELLQGLRDEPDERATPKDLSKLKKGLERLF